MKDSSANRKNSMLSISKVTSSVSFSDSTLSKKQKLSKERKRYIEEVSSKALSAVCV